MTEWMLKVSGLTVRRRVDSALVLEDVNLTIPLGAIVAIVGESGSGKTTLLNAILGLLPEELVVESGSIQFLRLSNEGQVPSGSVELLGMPTQERRRLLGRHIAYVPQDAMSGLNPLRSARAAVAETFATHLQLTGIELRQRTDQALRDAGLDEAFVAKDAQRRPTDLSGGQQQRVLVAQARALDPDLVLYDEPTTALDSKNQGAVLGAAVEAASQGHSAIIVTHNLAAVAPFAHYLAVMYAGTVVAWGATSALLQQANHPYLEDLLACIPRLDSDKPPTPIRGEPPARIEEVRGCRYHPRCRLAMPVCATERPRASTTTTVTQPWSACHAKF